MAKQQTIIQLYGVLADGTRAKTSDADDVVTFIGDSNIMPGYFKVSHPELGLVTITTPLGQYEENNCAKLGSVHRFNIHGIKAHVTFKKIVGKLIFWA